MKVLISKSEILRITHNEYPDFNICPQWVLVDVFDGTIGVDKKKRATIKSIKK